eukprot:TRINITY_DN9171_c0_g2_i5.p1 TRINITY_DN9171_c0_g2~~TRINITY_DN9171_c0_g2_i5.p1  ORF type:complete len:501 (+),score=29.46 TRINITY_DN9171_c0_g2_i5:117-1505(+)
MASSSEGPTLTVLDGLGGDVHEVSLDTVKSSFFLLGMQVGMGLQMFAVATLVLFLAQPGSGVLSVLAETYYPLFRACFYVCLFFSCYGCDLFVWKRSGINCRGILGVEADQNYHFVIRWSTLLMSVVFTCFLLYLFSLTGIVKTDPTIWPAVVVALLCLLVLSPVSIFSFNFSTQRWRLIRTIVLVLLSPFSKVSFSRILIADALTSMPKLLSDILYTVCLYTSGRYVISKSTWRETENEVGLLEVAECSDADPIYKVVQIILSVLPFWIRLMQCIRAFVDTHALPNVFNGLKYCMSMAVVALSFVFHSWHIYWVIMSVLSTLYAFSWDMLMDWGLGPGFLRRALHGEELGGSANGILRPIRLYSSTKFYYFALCSNALARFGWALYISPGQKIVSRHFVLLLGCAELLRRVQWALLRVEWEHIRRHVHGAAVKANSRTVLQLGRLCKTFNTPSTGKPRMLV